MRSSDSSALFVVGVGRVGQAVLDELQRLPEAPRVIGIARSSGAWLEPEGLQTGSWRERITAEPDGALDDLVASAIDHPAAARIVVDCTAGHALAAHYCELLEAGVAVVSANKLPFAGPLADYHRCFEAAATAPLRIEATVGAGLPVLCTLGDLIRTGDRVLRIEGVLSGTLAHLCDRLDAGDTLSAAVRNALQLGMTEPDPRDDLAGQDVVRKLVILARTAGFDLEPEAVQAEPFLDDPKLFELDESSWWDRLAAHDAAIARRWNEARKHGNRSAYLATFADGHASVRLEEVPPEHPVASLSGTDNMVAFTTRRYPTHPLVIRGPGAGPEVTAAGVLADILHARGVLRGR
jgi:aspartokinase/homoserine dehydrogenase 1